MHDRKDSELIIVDEKYKPTQKEEKKNTIKGKEHKSTYMQRSAVSFNYSMTNFHEDRGESIEYQPNLVMDYKYVFIRFVYACLAEKLSIRLALLKRVFFSQWLVCALSTFKFSELKHLSSWRMETN